MSDADLAVLESSQITTPEAFWEAYVTEIPLEGASEFGRNLDALWDALSAGGPGMPRVTRLEVHNTEQLATHGHADFLDKLRSIAAALAVLNGVCKLSIVASEPSPRGRIYQHTQLRSRELAGRTIERALYSNKHRSIVWLKPAGSSWQRFFPDAGFAVWEEWSDELTREEFEELADELEPLPALVGQSVSMIEFVPTCGLTAEIRFRTESGSCVRIRPQDEGDFDTDYVLIVEVPTFANT